MTACVPCSEVQAVQPIFRSESSTAGSSLAVDTAEDEPFTMSCASACRILIGTTKHKIHWTSTVHVQILVASIPYCT